MAKRAKQEETKKLETQEKELEEQLKRTLADYQNLEKRVALEREDLIRSANKGLILRLLPALDALILAEKHTKDEGVALSIKKFLDILENEGVKQIETKGKEFDPKVMECVQAREVDPSTGSGQEGIVIEEIKQGYIMEEKVLRPAQVIVGKKG
ncbi:MAG: nucleotide exchange factor GrpE [Candidatus Levybacteria bacterium]|nr:nucleotide exchange factor GrpE [Candidatus Levybacteria bacterium]